ncbi:glycosyltransferase family 4 protein [Flavobacterium orientale]|uniref:Uncharacterized protein n=1 Tax=Flavobacterium orientale TaxID=1756020 RepID=A0A916XV58_9FLAO|nr:glycosyltransferase family 4 protein [Flavobacterium orientale]GGD14964.1 hypothetical protein GCM10011343_02480 [Flavobacterium orientale]
MKILYIFEKYPGTYQMYIHNLIELLRKKNSLKVLSYSVHKESDIVINTYGWLDQWCRFRNYLGFSKYRSLDIKKMMSFDIVHVQHSFLFSKIIPLFELQDRPKIIITLRGGDTYIKPWVDKRWVDFYSNYGTKVDAFITMSQHQKEYLKKWGIPDEKIYVVPISFGTYSNAKPKYPNKEKLYLVSAFRMTWEKNIAGSILLAKKLKDKEINFEYDIYGDGHDFGQLHYLVDKYELSGYVNIKHKIANKDLKQILPRYDFFLQLSLSEALPTSILEAQSLGVNCVVSDTGGMPEVVNQGKVGVISTFDDYDYFVNQILNLWEDEEAYFYSSKKAIDFVNSNFTIELETERLNKLYKTLLNC